MVAPTMCAPEGSEMVPETVASVPCASAKDANTRKRTKKAALVRRWFIIDLQVEANSAYREVYAVLLPAVNFFYKLHETNLPAGRFNHRKGLQRAFCYGLVDFPQAEPTRNWI